MKKGIVGKAPRLVPRTQVASVYAPHDTFGLTADEENVACTTAVFLLFPIYESALRLPRAPSSIATELASTHFPLVPTITEEG